MDWIAAQSEWAKPLGVVVGAILALWALVGRLDKALLAHLTSSFATKEDHERLEAKIDTILRTMWKERIAARRSKD